MATRLLSRRTAGAAALAATLTAAGCGWLWPGQTKADTPPPLSDSDRHFALQAAAAVQYQVEAAKLAEQRALDPQVRAYAALLMQENGRAIDEMKALVAPTDLTWIGDMPAERRAVLVAIASLPATIFDRRFIEQVGITDHEVDLALFEGASHSVSDQALRAWTEHMVPLLQQHLSVAQQLQVRLLVRA